MNEFEIIDKYFSPLSLKKKGSYNLKDDIFFDYKKKISISIDTYVEKKHFLDFKSPDLVIKKIFRSAMSDLICKGIDPEYYLLSASGNRNHFNKRNLKLIVKTLKNEQKKFNISLVGGDTTNSRILSFTFIAVGYSKKKPVLRNTAKKDDDIYVTGNLGDSHIGLKILKKEINLNNIDKTYFLRAYYNPKIQTLFPKKLINFASSSIDISDGLYQDLNHLLKKNKLNFYVDVCKIPISKKLKYILYNKNIKKINVISQGDDYQILFTANKKYRKQINEISKKNYIKVTRIGMVKSKNHNKLTFLPKNLGYIHIF